MRVRVPAGVALTAMVACLVVGFGSSAARSQASTASRRPTQAYAIRGRALITLVWSANKNYTAGACDVSVAGSGTETWQMTGNWITKGTVNQKYGYYAPSRDYDAGGKGGPTVNIVQSDEGNGGYNESGTCPLPPGNPPLSGAAPTSGCGSVPVHRRRMVRGGAPSDFGFEDSTVQRGKRPDAKGAALYIYWNSEYGLMAPPKPYLLCPFAWGWNGLGGTGGGFPVDPTPNGGTPPTSVTGSNGFTWYALTHKTRFIRQNATTTMHYGLSTGIGHPVGKGVVDVGTLTLTETVHVLLCLKSKGGCGSRQP